MVNISIKLYILILILYVLYINQLLTAGVPPCRFAAVPTRSSSINPRVAPNTEDIPRECGVRQNLVVNHHVYLVSIHGVYRKILETPCLKGVLQRFSIIKYLDHCHFIGILVHHFLAHTHTHFRDD